MCNCFQINRLYFTLRLRCDSPEPETLAVHNVGLISTPKPKYVRDDPYAGRPNNETSGGSCRMSNLRNSHVAL